MLQIQNLTITHLKDLRILIEDFSFALNPGDKAVIIGEEGNGKSTLLKLIYDEELIRGYAEYEGTILKGNSTFGYLAQELSPEEKQKSILEFYSELPSFFELSQRELAEAARQLGMSPDFFYSDQRVGELSGGEKVKLQLAKIMLQRPDILLLDEPSNDLDIDTLEWLENFINSCSMPVLYISHDETLIEHTANLIIHLEQIRRKTLPRHTIARMDYQRYVTERLSKFTHQEQEAVNERIEYRKQQERFRKIQQKVEHQQNVISRGDPHGGQLLKKKMKSIKSMERRFDKEYENMTEFPETEEAIFAKFADGAVIPDGKTVLMLELEDLRIQDRILARNLKLSIKGREKICIIGRNGAGKTTLIKKIAEGLLERTDIKAAYMPQNYEDLLDFSLTPVEFLSRTFEKEETTRIRTYLGAMKYTAEEMDHPISELSGGQKAKLLFLKISMEEYNVLILDEPTRNFSPLSNPMIRRILKSYNGAIISISHDRKYISEVCTKVYRLTEEGLESVDM